MAWSSRFNSYDTMGEGHRFRSYWTHGRVPEFWPLRPKSRSNEHIFQHVSWPFLALIHYPLASRMGGQTNLCVWQWQINRWWRGTILCDSDLLHLTPWWSRLHFELISQIPNGFAMFRSCFCSFIFFGKNNKNKYKDMQNMQSRRALTIICIPGWWCVFFHILGIIIPSD